MDTKSKMQELRPIINAALAKIAKENGLKSLQLAPRGTYDLSGALTWKVEGVVEGGLNKEATQYTMVQKYDSGLPPLGWSFESRSGQMTIVGKNRGGKIITSCTDGRQYLWRIDAVKAKYEVATKKAA